jgi:predicted nucleic-acid-binding Zn-ribbon protein
MTDELTPNSIKKCPKCGTEMKPAHVVSHGRVRLIKSGDLLGDYIVSFVCEKCGYIELYNEKILKKVES